MAESLMKKLYLFLVITVLVLPACNRQSSPEVVVEEAPVNVSVDAIEAEIATRAQAPLLAGLGGFTHPITTADPWAQRYFDQGMAMASGFNHAQSIRAFKAA